MRILALTYHNIGPFTKPISIVLKQGCFLIKAPIGRGKSFLFFDGILYALYKKSHRSMLNATAKSGFIHCLIDVEGTAYLIQRQLTKTKIGNDSCQTRLFSLAHIPRLPSGAVIRHGDCVKEIIADLAMEEIMTKNEKDLQDVLESVLPPYELWVNTTMIMQDSSNIFLLPPAQRMDVLKYMFDLLSIEDAEKILYDKKKELDGQIKALSHTDDATNRLRAQLSLLSDLWSHLDTFWREGKDRGTQTIAQLDVIRESVSIEDCAWNSDDFAVEEGLKELDKILNQWLVYETLSHDLRHQIAHQEQSIRDLTKYINDIDHQIAQYQDVAVPDSEPFLHILREEENKRMTQRSKIPDAFVQASNIHIPVSFDPSALTLVHTRIEAIIKEGKDCKARIDALNAEKETVTKQLADRHGRLQEKAVGSPAYEAEKARLLKDFLSRLEKEYAHRHLLKASREADYAQRQSLMTKLHQEYEHEKKNLELTTHFFCDKIEGNCPYITTLNTTAIKKQETIVSSLRQRLDEGEARKKTLDMQYNERKKQEHEYQTYLTNPAQHPDYITIQQQLDQWSQNTDVHRAINDLTNRLHQIEELLTTLIQERERLVSIFSSRSFRQYNDRHTQTHEIQISVLEAQTIYQKHLATANELAKKYEQHRQRLADRQARSQTLEEKKAELTSLHDRLATLKQPEIDRQRAEQYHETIRQIARVIDSINVLITGAKERALQATTLKHQAEKIANLHHLMKHELVLLALNHYLPTIEDTMNALLAQVVDYRVQMSITGDTKLELDISVHDQLGARDIKSLSGGQNTLIRLCRTLAVAAFQRSPMIFLDETINNLDQEAISRVADLIASVVKQQTKSLYVVTHSETIQAMSIWTEIIEID